MTNLSIARALRLLALCLICPSLLAAAAPARADDPVVARMDGDEIKASEVEKLLQAAQPAVRGQLVANPKALGALLRDELGRRAVLREADQAKWAQRPQVAAEIARARADVIVRTYLAAAAPPAGEISDAALRQIYDDNRDRFLQPRQYHLAQIFVAAPSSASPQERDAAQARVQDLAKRAAASPEAFAALARADSDDKASAAHDGDLGWLGEASLVPAIATAVHGMNEGEVSAPIDTKDGWHIIREIAIKPAAPLPFEQVKDAIADGVRREQAQRAQQAYVEKLLATRNALVNEIALKKVTDDLAR